MKNRLLIAFVVVSMSCMSLSSFAYEPGPDYSKLVVKVIKKGALPITLVFGSVEAHSAYKEFCSHLSHAEDITACTAKHMTAQQIEDLQDIAYQAELVIEHVIVPGAVEFWDENGDAIKQGASDAAADGFIALDNWLNK